MKNIKPILFSTSMVQAILEGRKTQTRRLKGLASKNEYPNKWNRAGDPRRSANRVWDSRVEKNPNPLKVEFGFRHNDSPDGEIVYMTAPYKPGDILWVRETWSEGSDSFPYVHKAEYPYYIPSHIENIPKIEDMKWKPSIHMPKAACRIFLEVTDVRVERLQDISEADAIAEGVEEIHPAPFVIRYKNYLKNGISIIDTSRLSFLSLWISINGEGSWKANPWVFVYKFIQIEKPKNF